MSEFATRPILASDPASDFSCGKLPLDEFFQNHPLPNDRRGIGRTFVLPRPDRETEEGLPQVLGYYTLSMADIAALPSSLPSKLRRGLPKYPLPVALIGRLAVTRGPKDAASGDCCSAMPLRESKPSRNPLAVLA